mgnify:CR=1 FL=1|tara:strand:+ start:10301 stop:10657 length:357 start_codon:yes stop_codon:yes gene_type:complete
MAIATKVTTLTLTGSPPTMKARLPNGDKYHKHVVWVKMQGAGGLATTAEVKWVIDGEETNPLAANLYGFGDALTETGGESIVHEGIAPKGGALWIVADNTCDEIKHYAYDKRHLRVGD